MMHGPRTLIEFQEMFPDEQACWVYLRAVRWPDGFECPGCGHGESTWLPRRRLDQCRACRRQASMTAGTVLHGTRVALRIWFLAFFFMRCHKKGISALQFQRDTGLGSYRTAWTLLHKVRAAPRRACWRAAERPSTTRRSSSAERWEGGDGCARVSTSLSWSRRPTDPGSGNSSMSSTTRARRKTSQGRCRRDSPSSRLLGTHTRRILV